MDRPLPPTRSAWFAALTLPALVAGGVVHWVDGADALPWPPAVQRVADRVPARSPAVVVLGNSVARMALDPAQLDALVVGDVVQVTLDGTAPVGWAALYSRLVAERGLRPTWVLVPSTVAGLDAAQAETSAARVATSALLRSDDADLLAAAGAPSGWWRRVERRRGQVQEALAGLVARAVHPRLALPSLALGRAQEAVYGAEGAIDPDAAGGVLPVDPFAPPPAAGRSALPELAARVGASGAQLVVVQVPVRGGEGIDADRRTRIRRGLLPYGARWLDLSGVALPEDAYADDTHLAASGRAVLTRAVAAQLRPAR